MYADTCRPFEGVLLKLCVRSYTSLTISLNSHNARYSGVNHPRLFGAIIAGRNRNSVAPAMASLL